MIRFCQVDGPTGRSYTFSELADLTKRCASALARRGLNKGDVVAMYSPNSPEFAIVFFGVLRAGGIVTAINPLYTGYEASLQLKRTGSKWLMTANSLVHRAKEAAQDAGIGTDHIVVSGEDVPECLLLSTLFEDDGSRFPEVQINPKEDVALLPFSSGTGGLPKAVMLTHFNLVADACIVCSFGFLNFRETSVVLAFLPFFHVYGLVIVMSLSLYRGSEVVTVPKFEQDKFLSLLEKRRVSCRLVVSRLFCPLIFGGGYELA